MISGFELFLNIFNDNLIMTHILLLEFILRRFTTKHFQILLVFDDAHQTLVVVSVFRILLKQLVNISIDHICPKKLILTTSKSVYTYIYSN